MNKKKYKQLDQKERDRIYLLKEKGLTNSNIAKRLGRNKSTIGREIKRNTHQKFHQYLPDTAGRKADKRRKSSRKKRYVDKHPRLKKSIAIRLEKGWSPDLIAGRLKRLKKLYLNQESIYQFIYSIEGKKANMRQYLRRAHRIRHKKSGHKAHKTIGIPNRTDIAKRPKSIDKRTQFGHWEGDTIQFKGHREKVVTTLVERKSRMVFLIKNNSKHSQGVIDKIKKKLESLPQKMFKTITFDQGCEFAAYRDLEQQNIRKVYYCEAHSPWQKGSNENMNGRLRWHLPSETDITKITQEELDALAAKMNRCPRKCLGYKTPQEVYFQQYKNDCRIWS